ncbi:MAG: hypothetical protein ACMUIU_00345 [bacterium]
MIHDSLLLRIILDYFPYNIKNIFFIIFFLPPMAIGSNIGSVHFNIVLSKKYEIKVFGYKIVLKMPETALREAIVNAIAHRDYTISVPIRIPIYEDRIEIRTSGGLPNIVKLYNLPFKQNKLGSTS